MSKNFCKDHEENLGKNREVSWAERAQAFIRYIQKPKTVYDLKDRSKALVLFLLIVLIVQYCIKYFISANPSLIK